jgi:hypothetical protein
MFPHHQSPDVRFAQAHNWFVVRSHSSEIKHVRRSFTQDGTGIRCRLHLIVDPSAPRTNGFIATFITYAAAISVVSFQYHHSRQSPSSNTAACKIKRKDSVAVAVAYMVKVKLAWVVVRTSAVGHRRAGATRVQVWCSGAQNCIALRQQRCFAAMGAIDARWAEYC